MALQFCVLQKIAAACCITTTQVKSLQKSLLIAKAELLLLWRRYQVARHFPWVAMISKLSLILVVISTSYPWRFSKDYILESIFFPREIFSFFNLSFELYECTFCTLPSLRILTGKNTLKWNSDTFEKYE